MRKVCFGPVWGEALYGAVGGNMQEFFGFRNFRQFERSRREIKLPYDLLNDIPIRAALELFEAKALFDGEESSINLRVANHRGKLYLDLCDRAWRAVEIDAEGWRIVDRPPPRFHHTRGSRPLPAPERGGSLDELSRFLNVDHQGWILIKAFLVAALRPSVPCLILVAKGEQGAGKTTACRIISALIDPRTGALRGVPREVRDLIAAARNSWLVCFDNLSHLPEELADAACRLAIGGGFGGRELYSDHDEAIFDATRPMVFNAIPDLGAARPDFLDRAVIVEFLDMKPVMRRDEAQFWREFEEVRPESWVHCSMPPRRDLGTCPTSGSISRCGWPTSRSK